MRVVPVMSTKGGTGKTKVCSAIARALRSMGFKVGLLDMDWVAPNLHIEFGISESQHLSLTSGVGDTIKPIISPEGFPLVSSAFIFPPDQAISMDEEAKIKDILEITSPGVVDWGELDYLLMDTPPTTAQFVHAALKINGLYGVVLVTQPASNSMADLLRTVSLLRDLQLPVLGLVGNQVFLTCPHGEKVNLYEMTEEDIMKFCRSQGVPYLGSVPHVLPNLGRPSLNGIVESLLSSTPVSLSPIKGSKLAYNLMVAISRRVKHAKPN